jgi:protein-disulfide isomerase
VLKRNQNLLFPLLLGVCCLAKAQNCPTLSASTKSSLVKYVREEYKIDEKSELTLIREDLVPNSCYRELTFEGKNAVKVWQLTMYLSPDQRFLSGEIFDTTLDPIEAERRKAAALMAGLSENKGASKGPDRAPVTIVVFADFECPYCKKLADLIDQVLPSAKDEVRVVFHHMPLSIHPWARIASEGAACAQLQGSEAFWRMHDKLFHYQAEITEENVGSKITEFAKSVEGLDLAAFRSCVDNQMSLGLVLRDINLASVNHVNATPTLFINGHRVVGVKDINQMGQLIAAAKEEDRQGFASTATPSQ